MDGRHPTNDSSANCEQPGYRRLTSTLHTTVGVDFSRLAFQWPFFSEQNNAEVFSHENSIVGISI